MENKQNIVCRVQSVFQLKNDRDYRVVLVQKDDNGNFLLIECDVVKESVVHSLRSNEWYQCVILGTRDEDLKVWPLLSGVIWIEEPDAQPAD